MALREEFAQQGDWLFRWRSFLPLLLLPPAGVALYESARSPLLFRHPYDCIFTVACILLSFSGMVVRAIAIGYSAKGTSGGNTKKQRADTLNTTGIYATVRHPLYLGNAIIFTGIVLFLKVWWFFAVSELLFALYYERIMYREEEFLRTKFGETYDAWANHTPAFIPRLHTWSSPKLPFSLWRIIKREYIGYFEIVASFTLLAGIQDYLIHGTVRFHPGWTLFFSVGFLFFIVIRIIKTVMKLRRRKKWIT